MPFREETETKTKAKKEKKPAPPPSKKPMSSGSRGDRAMKREYRKLRMKVLRSQAGRRPNRDTSGALSRMKQIMVEVPSVRNMTFATKLGVHPLV